MKPCPLKYNLHRKTAIFPAIALLLSVGFGFSSETIGQLDTDQKPNAKPQPTKFLRVTKNEAGEPQAMQTAITRYRPANGELVVDLIGAVHIGESDYYQQLNNQFKHYDVVLYELVAPEGTRIPRGGKKREAAPRGPMDLVSWMQGKTQSMLGLESQLELVDYQPKNFTHADMSPAQMSEKMAERGDTPLTIGLSAITDMLRDQSRSSSSKPSGAASLLSGDSLFDVIGDPLKMKRMMANQFADSGVMDMGMGGTLNQLLVVDRNAAALKVMQKEIVKGKKKIAIFYGAAHMPDFEKHLKDDFGLQKSKQVWIDAWDLTKAGNPSAKSNDPSKLLFKLLDDLGR